MPVLNYLLYPIVKFMERNPARKILNIGNAVLSPADGKVIYAKPINRSFMIEKCKEKISVSKILKDENYKTRYAYAVAVYMSPLDVHVNRSPIDGVVEKVYYKKGRLFRTSKKSSEMSNERNCIIIKNHRISVAVVQIAAKFFGKIICSLKEGQRIRKGDVIGIITLGSQVDVLISKTKGLKVAINKDKKVYAGISALCYF